MVLRVLGFLSVIFSIYVLVSRAVTGDWLGFSLIAGGILFLLAIGFIRERHGDDFR